MKRDAVVVLGSSATALAVAARLALDDREVVLWEEREHAAAIDSLRERRQIRLSDAGGDRVATLAQVTGDPFEALAAGDVLLAFVPPDSQSTFGDLLLPLIEPRHMLVLLPGRLGGLAHAKWLRDRGRGADGLPTIVESDFTPCACRRVEPDRLLVDAEVAHVGFGVFPSCRTTVALEALRRLFPGAYAHPHLLSAALGSLDPIVRSVAVLLNAGGEESCRSESFLYRDGLSSSAVRVVGALDAERVAIAAALGFEAPPAADALHAAGIAPRGDLWAALHGSYFLSQQRSPDVPERTRWLVQDVPFGLRTWVELAEQLDVRTPVIRSVIALCEVVTGVDPRSIGRSLEDLGIAGMTTAALVRYLESGNAEDTA